MANNKVNRVFVGIPSELVKSIFWVGREYRTNPLSLFLGGTDIVVEFSSGRVYGYDWVKYPGKYLEKLLSKEKFIQTGQKSAVDLHDMRSMVSRVYAGVNLEESAESRLHEVWSREKSEELPFKLLENFTSEGLKRYLDVFKRNLDLALKYISINFPFSYSFLLENWDDLDLGSATYSGFIGEIDRPVFSSFGLVYNHRIRWNSKLRTRFDFGFENPWMGYIDGTPGEPVDYNERDFLDVSIPLDIRIEIGKRNWAWIEESGIHVVRGAKDPDKINWDYLKQLNESLVSDQIPFLSPRELETMIKIESEKFLFNESLWEGTLKYVVDEDLCSLLLDEKRSNV